MLWINKRKYNEKLEKVTEGRLTESYFRVAVIQASFVTDEHWRKVYEQHGEGEYVVMAHTASGIKMIDKKLLPNEMIF